ncbi:MAG: glycerol-3-phosphate 1-O-acyltransferase PlsY [Rhizobium sp.]|nr:MAG: glycerol-3-phosphate 1-O-acyltransferase PlsY [Rhizobium sp.]
MYDIGIWPESMSLAVVTGALGYLLGSIPFGFILVRMAGHGDIRQTGSGNIGATNVLRTGKKGLAALTLFLDAAKAIVAIGLADHFGASNVAFAAVGALLGHMFPFELSFRGGKGVATYIGAAIAIHWPLAIAFAVAWLLTAAITRYSSLSAMVACIATPLAAFWMAGGAASLLFTSMSLLVIARHHANIGRLIDGTESKIGKRGVQNRNARSDF